MADFAHLKASAPRLATASDAAYLGGPECVDLFCRDCQFFRDDERSLECNALAVLKRLLSKKIISLEDVIRAVSD
ncbi:MAG: hypothetical protein D9V47_13765 [Clostridia bacterium]|nr:MAG: hypothetical protein D9V47_13765 [Clostridia bacterium]